MLFHHFDEFRTDAYVLADSPSSIIIATDYDSTIAADSKFYIGLIAAHRVSRHGDRWFAACIATTRRALRKSGINYTPH